MRWSLVVVGWVAAAGAVAPPTLRGVMDDASGAVTVGDTFEMSLSRVHCFPLPRKKFGTQATTIPLTVKCYDKTVTVAKGTVENCP